MVATRFLPVYVARAAVDTFAETIFPYMPHPSTGSQPEEKVLLLVPLDSAKRWSFDMVTEARDKRGGGGKGER